ncbi:MAG: folylpolyglutamate synthase/dihydrofolate synthase family protein [Candidatus Micrarchaeota archaeon]
MEDTLQYLYSLKNHGSKLGLERIETLLKKLNNPEKSFKSILVAGTNGKGSTVAIIDSVLRDAGFKVARYTSPHLSSLNERIVVNGKEISDDDLFRIVKSIRKIVDKEELQITFFEFITAVAFVYYNECKVDFAVLEVGLGGRLDATNVATPLISIITNISLEHTEILGDTIEKIAFEKGGIIKNNGALVTAAKDGLITLEKICDEKKSRTVIVGKDIIVKNYDPTTNEFDAELFDSTHHLKLGLKGRYQLENACCSLGALSILQQNGIIISEENIRRGFEKVTWPGRMETVQKNPFVILDCAKDAEAARNLSNIIKNDLKLKNIILVIGISSDKNIKEMVGALAPLAKKVIITTHKVGNRTAEPSVIAQYVKQEKEIVIDVKQAVKRALEIAGEHGVVLITGSVFVVGEAREIWFNKKTKLGLEFNDPTPSNIKLYHKS